MVRFYVIVGGLLLALVVAAFVGPGFVDWSQYRERFEAEASRVLGREVTVEGSASARFLPFPSIAFEDVTIGEAEGSRLVADAFAMDMELAPFLRGEYLIFDMRLSSPDLTLVIDEDGRVDGGLDFEALSPDDVSIEQLTIEDGVVRVIDRAVGREFEANSIDMVLSADTLAGPWVIEGDVSANGGVYNVAASTGLFEPDLREGVRLRGTVEGDALPAPLSVAGTLTLPGGIPRYEGEFTAEREGESPFALTGEFQLEPNGFEIGTYRMAVGGRDDPYVVEGSAALSGGRDPRFDLVARGQRLDTTRLEGTAIEIGDPSAIRAQLERLLAFVPSPDLAGNVDVALPAVVLGSTTARDVRLRANVENGTWNIARLSMELPGRTTIEVSGQLASTEPLAFQGEVVAASRQPTGLVTWFGRTPSDALRDVSRLGLEADVEIDGNDLSFPNVTFALGDQRVRGRIARSDVGQGLIAELSSADLDWDAAQAVWHGILGSENILSGSVRVVFDADRLVWDGQTLAGFRTEATLRDDVIEIDELDVRDLAGVSLDLTGTVSLDGTAASALDVAFDSNVPNAAIGLLRQKAPAGWTRALEARANELGPLSGQLELAWLEPRTTLGFELTADANGTRLAGGGALEWRSPDPIQGEPEALNGERQPELSSLALDITAESLSVALNQAGWKTNRPDDTPLEGRVEFEQGAGVQSVMLDLTVANDSWAVETVLGETNSTVDVSVALADAGRYTSIFGYDIAGASGTPLAFRASANGGEGLWRVDVADGMVDGTTFGLQVAGAGERWQGSATTESVSLPWLASLITDWDSSGFALGNVSDETLGAVTLPNIDLLLSVVANNAILPGNQIASVASFELGVRSGSLSIEDFDAALASGRVSGSASVRDIGGEFVVASRFEGLELDAVNLLGSRVPGLEAGLVSFEGSFETTGTSAFDLVRGATGAGSTTVLDPLWLGLDPLALSRIYATLDEQEFDTLDATTVSPIVEDELFDGPFAPRRIPIDWTISGGEVRIVQNEAADAGTIVTGTGSVDLLTGEVDGDARVTLAVPDDRAAGGDPTVRVVVDGSWDDAEATLDVGSLAGFLNLRAFEIERDRVAALRASLVEMQRLRRESILFATERRRQEEAEVQRQREEVERLRTQREAEEAASAAPALPQLDFDITN